MLPSGQRRDEHDERALRKVKIRDECIQAFELITGVDENIRPTQMTRPPLAFVSLTMRAVSSGMMQNSECIG